MTSSIIRNSIFWSIVSLLIVVFLIVRASFACAVTTARDVAHPNLIHTMHRERHDTAPGDQQNSQFLAGSNGGLNSTFVGAHQGNSGNQGLNRGLNQDNGGNSGNQISGQRKIIEFQNNDQQVQGGSDNSSSSSTYSGIDQGNSGNQGINRGFNQDNAGNSGNEVNNQGNVIGTQINNQGSEVNNNGSIIQHQVNVIGLLPSLQAHLSLFPKPQLSLRVN